MKKTDYGTTDKAGILSVGYVFSVSDGKINISAATETEIQNGQGNFKPIVSSKINVMMTDYGITSKNLINNILARLDALEYGSSAQSADVKQEIDKE